MQYISRFKIRLEVEEARLAYDANSNSDSFAPPGKNAKRGAKANEEEKEEEQQHSEL